MRDEVFVGKSFDRSIVKQILSGEVVIKNLNVEGMDRPMLSVIVPWGKEDELYGGIVMNAPITGIRSTIRSVREIVAWSMLFGIILATSLVSYHSWSISRPLKRIEQAATEIALGNYSKRVEHSSLDEIGELAKAFNRMAEKLDSVEKNRISYEQNRDDFIINISHELRTPLTAMQGFLEALQDGLVDDEASRKRYYEVMYNESKYLNRLVDDLMDLIKLDKGEVSLNLDYVNIEDVAKKAYFTLISNIENKNNTVEIENEDNLPLLLSDPVRIEQIFLNLIQNANKFTENGRILVKINCDGKYYCITISDTGIGIPSHDLNKIWDRFFKVNRSRSKTEGGTGLGLAIVKKLVDLHQGNINVESTLGKGTTFSIQIPINLNN